MTAMDDMDGMERERFDALVSKEVELLPFAIQLLLQETPLLVEDFPAQEILREFGIDDAHADQICGLHSGVGLTERSVEDPPDMPETITIYRSGIIALAGGWTEGADEDGKPCGGEEMIAKEIRITILHEVGHHYGLDEDDLDKLGFG